VIVARKTQTAIFRPFVTRTSNIAYYREVGSDTWISVIGLGEVTITPGNSSNGYYTGGYGGGGSSSNGDSSSNGGGSYSSNGSSFSSLYSSAADALSLAISHGLAWNEFYSTLNNVGPNTRITASTLLENLLEMAPIHSMQVDWANAQQWKGVAILNTAGRVLGVTTAASSVITLGADIFGESLKSGANFPKI
jgi:hypothetical protein